MVDRTGGKTMPCHWNIQGKQSNAACPACSCHQKCTMCLHQKHSPSEASDNVRREQQEKPLQMQSTILGESLSSILKANAQTLHASMIRLPFQCQTEFLLPDSDPSDTGFGYDHLVTAWNPHDDKADLVVETPNTDSPCLGHI